MTANASKPQRGKDQKPLVYVVQSGDNLTQIAQKFRTTVGELRKHNQGIVKGDLIFPGQKINIYGAAGAPSPALASLPAKPAPKPKSAQPTTPVVSSKGHPLALIDPSQQQAPWMEVAISEARRLGGKREGSIDANYHKETGADFLKSLEGTNNAWCASFVNWCLVGGGYAKWRNSFRAKAILQDENFAQIEDPVYGSIVLVGTHHVCFCSVTAPVEKGVLCDPYALEVISRTRSTSRNLVLMSDTLFHERTCHLQTVRLDEGRCWVPMM